ncbi:IclR family transcriptional regulator C-terminal domain-containing protein [Mycobacterium cookii]|uniref:IclR family transcriptional regulator C-terminal domain-containing protein n=3 Tax=Nocardioides furvisabuli TaxID=375542 RepID=A0ABP5J9Q6_9ACTN
MRATSVGSVVRVAREGMVNAIPSERPGREAAAVDRGVLRRAVAVLDVLAAHDVPPAVRVIAQESGLSKSAVQRILVELEAVDLAIQDPATRRYRLGPRALALGVAYQRRLNVREVALGPMESLCAIVEETVGLSVGYADRLLHVEQVLPQRDLSAQFQLGQPLPLWSGAPARVILAERTDDEVRRVLADYAHTDIEPINPPSPETLQREVELVRRNGHARAFGETIAEIHTLSVPVRGAHSQLVAVLSITAPSSRLSESRMDVVLPAVTETAAVISNQLGHRT